MADVMNPVEEPTMVAESKRPSRSSSSWRNSWLTVLSLPVGAIVVYVGLATMNSSTASVRIALTVAGLAGAYAGLSALVNRIAGRNIDLGFWLSAIWVGVVILAAIFADFLPFAEARNPAVTLTQPSRLRPDLFSGHPLGTDTQALDILGGVIYGARVSLQVSLIAVTVGTITGGLIGVIAGYFGGRLDGTIGIFVDSLLAFPPLILLLAVVTVVTPGVLTISLALALLGIPTYIRLARANTLTFAQREFVLAARALGAKRWRIISRELVPNVIRPLLSYSFIIIAVLIVAEASLSFLGVGIQRPTPTWGNMISAGQAELERTPHLVFVPGGVMFVTVFCLNRLGDRLRKMWDPRQSGL